MHSLKRAGYPLSEIMKLTGHKTLETLAKSYDLRLDTKERVNMSAAIGFGAQLSRGAIQEVKGKKQYN